jgi:hypothetical protein
MQLFRIVPVGDKLVRIAEVAVDRSPMIGGTIFSSMPEADAACYDFFIGGVIGYETNEISATIGGNSNE